MAKSTSEQLNLQRLVGTGLALLDDTRAVGGRGSPRSQTAEPVPALGTGSSRFGSWRKRLAGAAGGILPGFWLLILGWVVAIYFVTYFLLPRLPLSASGNVYIVQPAMWMSLALAGFLLWRWGLEDRPRLSPYIVALGLLASVFHIALLILAGMIAGFGHSPYGDSPEVMAQNLLYVGSGVLGLELARAYLLAVFARRSSLAALAVVSLLLALVTIPKARFMDLGGGEGGFETLGDTFLPSVSESLLASFLALVGGPLASIAYRGALEAFQWFSPILPDLNWSATAFVGTLAPALALLILRGLTVSAPAKDAPREAHRDSWVLFPSGVAIAAVSLLWLGTGLLGVRPALVSGHSMEPALRTGDVVLTREVSEDDVAVGDIVRFTKGSTTIIHRVNEVYASGGTTWIVTKGDANNVNDDPITADQVDGEVLLTIPKIGWIGTFVRNAAVSGLGGGGPPLWLWTAVGGIILAGVALLTWREISARARANRHQDPAPAVAILQRRLGNEATPPEAHQAPAPVPTPVGPPPRPTPPPRPAALQHPPPHQAQALSEILESIGAAISVVVTVIALWAEERGLARAIARLFGRRDRRARRAPAYQPRVATPAAPVTKELVPSEAPLRRRPRRALALASLAAAQAIGVAVAVGALWAAGTVSFSGDSGTCPDEPRTLATEPAPQTIAALDAPALEPVAPPAAAAPSEADGASRAPAITAAPEADGSPPTPAVAAATREPTTVATPLPPAAEEQPPTAPQTAQPPATAPPAIPTLDYVVQPGDTLFDIALRFGTTVDALVQLNGLTTAQVVWAGQVLQVASAAPPAAPTPPTPPPPDVPTVEYTVRSGERLSDVAAFFGTTVQAIVSLNGLADANLVVPGQVLLVPAPPANTAPGQAFTSEYVVQPGETLTDIAARFGTTVATLAAENNLANPSTIRIGDRLRVP